MLSVFSFIILISSICPRGREGRVLGCIDGLLDPYEEEKQKKAAGTHTKKRQENCKGGSARVLSTTDKLGNRLLTDALSLHEAINHDYCLA